MLSSITRYFEKPSSPQVLQDEIPRTLCPQVVDDLQTWLLYDKKKESIYCIGSLSQDKYIEVPASKLALTQEIISLFDGEHSLDEIQRLYYEDKHLDVNIKQLYTLLFNAGLLKYPRPERVTESEFKRLSLPLIAVNLDRFYQFLSRFNNKTITYLVVVSSLAVILASLWVFPRDLLQSGRYYQFANSYSVGFAIMIIGLLFAIILHELSHGWVATWYGLNPKQLRVGLYLGFMMFFYVEIRGIYTIKPANRIKIWLAGPYTNLFLGCFFLLIRQLTMGTGWYGDLLLKLALSNFMMVTANLFPFAPTDGYFIISTLAKVTNLRTNAFNGFMNLLLRREAKLSLPIAAYLVVSMYVILNALLMQIRWLWKMIQRLYLEPPTQSPGEYIFTLVLVLLFILGPVWGWFQRVRWNTQSGTFKTQRRACLPDNDCIREEQ